MTNKYKTELKQENTGAQGPVKEVLSGNFLSRDKVISTLPFILFLTIMGLLYISNGYQAEKTVRDLYKMNAEVKELRSEYITSKSELMQLSKQSQVARAVQILGLKELTEPPQKIVIDED